LISRLIHLKGHAAPETKAAIERACQLIEQAEALGEPPEDPLLLFAVLFGFWASNLIECRAEFNADAVRELAEQLLALAENQTTTVSVVIAHRVMGLSLMSTGDLVGARAHLDKAIAFYDPAEHRSLASRFNADALVASLSFRSLTLWLLGYPEAALVDGSQALEKAREMGSAGSSMTALAFVPLVHIECGNYNAANKEAEQLGALANEKDASLWKAAAVLLQPASQEAGAEAPQCARVQVVPATEETEVARLTRELSEERKQRTATSEVLHLLSGSHGDLNRLFDTILSNATKLCQATFGALFLCEACHSACNIDPLSRGIGVQN
jgi:tetratricopeptide (TPR) repeat protein